MAALTDYLASLPAAQTVILIAGGSAFTALFVAFGLHHAMHIAGVIVWGR